MNSLCQSCAFVRHITSASGSQFLLCQWSQHDVRYPKYPVQPQTDCAAYHAIDSGRLPDSQFDGPAAPVTLV